MIVTRRDDSSLFADPATTSVDAAPRRDVTRRRGEHQDPATASVGAAPRRDVTRRRAVAMTLVAIALAACGARAAPPALEARVEAVGDGDAIGAVEAGDALYVFWRERAAILRGGRSAATVPAPGAAWASAAVAPAFDGEGSWIVARTVTGGLWRVLPDGDLEPIEDRIGLPARVRSFAAAGGTIAALHDDGLAVVRERHVLAFGEPARGEVLVGADRLAVRDGASIQLWDLARATRTRLEVPAARAAAFVDRRLAVATDEAIFVEGERGLRPLRAPGRVRAIAAAGPHLWVLAGGALYRLAGERFARVSSPPAAGATALFGLAGGDVVLVSPGAVQRIAPGGGDWEARVRPIFERVCAACHLPGGRAGVDLSTAATWSAHRGDLVERVVTARTMPPPGVALSEEDRRILAAYLGR